MPYRLPLAAALVVTLLTTGLAGAQDLLLTNAHLLDPATETHHAGVALEIRDGRVVAHHTTPPEGFEGTVLDLNGSYVVPGFIDLHTHSFGNVAPVGIPEMVGTPAVAQRMLYAGVTAFLDLFSPEAFILGLRNRQRTSGLPGADLYAAGPILTCTGGHGTEYGLPTRTVDTPEEARSVVADLAQQQPDVVKLVYHPHQTRGFPSMDQPTMQALLAEAQAQGLKTVAHVETWRGVADVMAAGVTAITHTPIGSPPDSLVAALQARGVVAIPTLTVHTELDALATDPSRLDTPLLSALANEGLRASYRDTTAYPPRMRGWMRWQNQQRADRLAAVATLARAGVPVAVGTDGGNPGIIQGYSVHREMALFVAAGLTPWQALAAATTVPRAFLGLPEPFAPGSPANLVVLAQDPLDDIAHTETLTYVIQRGVVVDRAALRP